MRRTGRAVGFTLVELLVVVAIIGLLLGILVPNIMKGMDQAKQLKCATNLRNIGQSCILYANEQVLFPFKGDISQGSQGNTDASQNLGASTLELIVQTGFYDADPSIFVCPVSVDKAETSQAKGVDGKSIADPTKFSLDGAFQGTCSYTFTAKPLRQNDRSSEVLSADNCVRNPEDSKTGSGEKNQDPDNHKDGRNFLYLGGNVEFVKFEGKDAQVYQKLVTNLYPR